MPSGTLTSSTKAELFVHAGAVVGVAVGTVGAAADAICVVGVAAGDDAVPGVTETVIAAGSLTTPDLLYARTITVCVPSVAFQL